MTDDIFVKKMSAENRQLTYANVSRLCQFTDCPARTKQTLTYHNNNDSELLFRILVGNSVSRDMLSETIKKKLVQPKKDQKQTKCYYHSAEPC